jgi:hypothetical protein
MLMWPYGRKGKPYGRESPIKHGREILPLLEAIHLPREVAIICCWGHQRDLTLETQGNNWAEQKAKQSALQSLDALPASILSLIPPQEPVYPKYTPDEEKERRTQTGSLVACGW